MGHCDVCTVKSQMHRWPPGLSSRRALASAAFQSGIIVRAYEMLTCDAHNVPYHIFRLARTVIGCWKITERVGKCAVCLSSTAPTNSHVV
jgi:hypothetical protein